MKRGSRIFRIGSALVLGMAAGLLALASWAIAPFPIEPAVSLRTAGWIARAPFAERIVIGDSRIEWAEPTDEALFVGYGGATFRHLERVTSLLCAISDAPVAIALGVNDSKQSELDVPASLASAQAMVAACRDDGVVLAQIWPTDPGTEPAGGMYDLAAIDRIDEGLARIATSQHIAWLAAPQLSGHTIDGVHFSDAISRRYLSDLAQAAQAAKVVR